MWYIKDKNILDFRSNLQGHKNLSAAQQAIEYIKNNFSSPYHLMLSGGVDSQAMLYAWNFFAKGQFIPISIIYDKNYFFNQHDLQTLAKVSNCWNVKVLYKEFDILKFYQNRYYDVAEEFQCSSPQICTYIEMTRDLEGTVIFSGNWLGYFGYNKVLHALTLYSQKRSCIPFFFVSQPDIAYTGVNLKLQYDREDHSLDKMYTRRVSEYNLAGYPVERQIKKLTGFEKIKDYFDDNIWPTISPKEKFFYLNKQKLSSSSYDLLLRYPLEEKFGNTDFTVLVNP